MHGERELERGQGHEDEIVRLGSVSANEAFLVSMPTMCASGAHLGKPRTAGFLQ